MDAWASGKFRDRSDRYVRRAQLLVAPGDPVRRLAFTVEEALRLATLPGESEGRSYYFRTIRLTGLPSGGDRSVWLDRFQQVLRQHAIHAVHGADPGAALAESVYFRSDEEALEILLHRLLARRTVDEWYWPRVAAAAGPGDGRLFQRGSFSSAETIRRIVQELRARPASWVAVAAALFASPAFDVVRLFDAIAPAVAHGWLREMEGQRPVRSSAAAEIPSAARSAVQQSLRAFGPQDPRTLWLAALAILLESPSHLASGIVVGHARVALQQFVSVAKESQPEVERRAGVPSPQSSSEALPSAAEAPARPSAFRPDTPAFDPNGESPTTYPPAPQGPVELEPPLPVPASPPAAPAPSLVQPDRPTPLSDSHPWQCVGEPTGAVGLFFLLNALERIGISQALAEFGGAVPDFTARVLKRLALQAGTAPNDPILLWLASQISGAASADPLPCNTSWWPANLPRSCSATNVHDLVRAWSLGARRWLWRAGRISVRETIARPGVFSVNRTDVDISLPLEGADIRVRRVGLDLDPGWLPWFGRVVRFHYLSSGELHATGGSGDR